MQTNQFSADGHKVQNREGFVKILHDQARNQKALSYSSISILEYNDSLNYLIKAIHNWQVSMKVWYINV